ncbi:hypothetical protein J1N35_037258 [Gossypium stocksii]|uniref:Retrotransposon Copia-like N-terminal domain-containing protein n=1 Tax=Gossypium stocksii TaxID=47602 RepID=A0A9D3ZLI3_9ROSI|nr:hypothetical protein J1N35_037258 [Gossypium stocksii]
MATKAVSGNDDGVCQSFNTGTPVAAYSLDLGCEFLKKVQHFPKHDTVKLTDRNFLLWKQQIFLILEGYEIHEFVLGMINVPPQTILDSNALPVSGYGIDFFFFMTWSSL